MSTGLVLFGFSVPKIKKLKQLVTMEEPGLVPHANISSKQSKCRNIEDETIKQVEENMRESS